jgi:hypothetical protein
MHAWMVWVCREYVCVDVLHACTHVMYACIWVSGVLSLSSQETEEVGIRFALQYFAPLHDVEYSQMS